jgi:hypothetical protein
MTFFETPRWQTRALLRHQPDIAGVVLDPCAGNGSIASVVSRSGTRVSTNDWDTDLSADWHLDARSPDLYARVGPVDWVVSNPPYAIPMCLDVVVRAVREARIGVAMLLRISFREPTRHRFPRGPWLKKNPVSRVLTFPRYSYRVDGKLESATTEWVVWLKRPVRSDEWAILSLSGEEE